MRVGFMPGTWSALIALVGCVPIPPPSNDGLIEISFDFRAGNPLGWEAGISDYPVEQEENLQFLAEMRGFPPETGIAGTALYVHSFNTPDDLFTFLRRKLGPQHGVVPGREYRVDYEVYFASNAPTGCFGVGGAPGESVFLKAGAAAVEPEAIEHNGHVDLNVDKGDQMNGGTAASLVSTIANGVPCDRIPDLEAAPYVLLLRAHAHPTAVRAGGDAVIWLLIGVESGFESLTGVYYHRIDVRLEPLEWPKVNTNRLPRLAFLLSVASVFLGGAIAPAETDELGREFQRHIEYLASDELAGRAPGSPGIELAAEYLAREFAAAGLSPGGDRGTYFQSFPLTLHRELKEGGRLSISGDSKQRRHGVDFIPFNFSSDDEFSGGLVFAGYGISHDERKHDDFAGIDLTGCVALVFAGEPASWAGHDGAPTRHAGLRNKVYNAKDRGAVAILVVNPALAPGEEDRLTDFFAEGADQYGLPAFHLTREMADDAVNAARIGPLDALQQKLDAGTPASTPMAHMKASGKASFEKKTSPTRNVVGLHRGKGENAGEYVVIGAHYDHLGVRKPMMRTFKAGKIVEESAEPQIHNGADDNASGTSGLIAIARMFAAALPTDRSVLFVAFSAEESGLHGSKHYVDSPPAPIEKTVAMLNMDMIGRMPAGGGSVQVFGVESGSSFGQILESKAGGLGLKIAPGVDYGGRSDHASFLRRQVPSMHFYTGAHPDYHKPTDDADKINVEGGAKVARLVFEVAHELAVRPDRPAYLPPSRDPDRQEAATGASMTYRVVMGLTPAYGDDGRPGMGVDAVSPEGPADIAGMKAGDRIIKINGKSIANVYDYMAATRNNKAGEAVEVVVLREGQEKTVRVVLAGAK